MVCTASAGMHAVVTPPPPTGMIPNLLPFVTPGAPPPPPPQTPPWRNRVTPTATRMFLGLSLQVSG